MMMYKPQPVKKPTNFKTLPLGLPLAAAAVGTVAALAFVFPRGNDRLVWTAWQLCSGEIGRAHV